MFLDRVLCTLLLSTIAVTLSPVTVANDDCEAIIPFSEQPSHSLGSLTSVVPACTHTRPWTPKLSELRNELGKNLAWAIPRYRAVRGPIFVLGSSALTVNNRKLISGSHLIKELRGKWNKRNYAHPRPAALCFANLSNVNLSGAELVAANLYRADLANAQLSSADLDSADLDFSNLTGGQLSYASLDDTSAKFATLVRSRLTHALISADLACADLTSAVIGSADAEDSVFISAQLESADFTGANLSGADLTGAKAEGTTLTNAILIGSILRSSFLEDANLSNAQLTSSDLTDAHYEPKLNLPNANAVSGIVGLESLRKEVSVPVTGMIQLRALLKRAGLGDDVRAISASIERAKTDEYRLHGITSAEGVHGYLRFLAFDVTTAYGWRPEQALLLIILLGAILVPIYMGAVIQGARAKEGGFERPQHAASGIYRITNVSEGASTSGSARDGVNSDSPKRISARGWAAFGWASYFSLLSAVNIGFQEFTPGEWIRRLQPTDFSLGASGWVRVVAGAQSLLSVYLLAMWALTRFGNLFQ